MSAATRAGAAGARASASDRAVASALATRGARVRTARAPAADATARFCRASSASTSARRSGRALAAARGASADAAARGARAPGRRAPFHVQAIAAPGDAVGNHPTDRGSGRDEGPDRGPKDERVGVLLLNLGGPECLEDVQPFLYNLFADPDIIRLPPFLRFLQQPLAALLSTNRAPKSREAYESIGGGSPLRRITDEQAAAIREAMARKGEHSAKVYVGMRYWKPFTEDAVAQIKEDGVTKLVVLPLYPQFSISTSGSSLRLLEQMFQDDEYLGAELEHVVIPSWYQRPGYVKSMAKLIKNELNNPARGFEPGEKPVVFFSAHGVPVSYVETAGDPYKEEMERCVKLIVEELRAMGVENEHVLAYQSRVGPVEWLKPYTDDVIRQMGEDGVKSMVAVPVSFVSEHIETLEEIDMEYRELAEASGIERWGRAPALDTDQTFIDDLADACLESLAGMRGEKIAGVRPDAAYDSAYDSVAKASAAAGVIPPVPAMPAGSGSGDEVPTVGDLLGVRPEPWRWGVLELAFVAVSILLSTMLLMDGNTGAGLNEAIFK